MTIWSGLGINYGHNFAVYDTSLVESDFSFLWAQGIRNLRIAFSGYQSTTSIANSQDMIRRGLARGFYVVWGVSSGTGSPNLTATIWNAMKTTITGTIAPWAQTNGLSELCLCNEEDMNVDGTTLTAATLRADVRTLAATVKTNGYTGKVSYSTSVSSTYYNPWVSEGIGTLDMIGWNSYDLQANFTGMSTTMVANFGASHTYVSEWGWVTSGFTPDYSGSENAHTADVLVRLNSMVSAGVPKGYFFCYRDGGGLPPNSFGLVQTNNVAHCARGMLFNTPGQKLFKKF